MAWCGCGHHAVRKRGEPGWWQEGVPAARPTGGRHEPRRVQPVVRSAGGAVRAQTRWLRRWALGRHQETRRRTPWPQRPRTGEVGRFHLGGAGWPSSLGAGASCAQVGRHPGRRRRRCVLDRSGVNLRRARGSRGVVRSSPPSGPRPGRPREVRCEPLVAGAGAVGEGAFRRWWHSRQCGVGAGALDRSGLNLRRARGGHRSDHALLPSPARGSGELGQVRREPQVARARARPAGRQPRRSTARGSPASGSDAVVGDRTWRAPGQRRPGQVLTRR